MSRDEIVKRIVEKGREKYRLGFGDEAPIGEKRMERLVRKALDRYLSAYETSFFDRLFTRPFPWLFRSEEEVRKSMDIII